MIIRKKEIYDLNARGNIRMKEMSGLNTRGNDGTLILKPAVSRSSWLGLLLKTWDESFVIPLSIQHLFLLLFQYIPRDQGLEVIVHVLLLLF